MASSAPHAARPASDPAPNPAATSAPTFASLGVPEALCEVLALQGITTAFPIQAAALPDALAGHNVLGRGRTGSGKTLAFAIPVLARLAETVRARRPAAPRGLILAPTRELAQQILRTVEPLASTLGLRSVVIFGGVNQNPQVRALRQGVDLVIACPGRLEDLLEQRALTLEQVEVTVIDEADHMADLGFLPPVTRLLLKTSTTGQRLLFSATLDRGVDGLVKRFLSNPITHGVDSEQSPVADMEHHVLHIAAEDRLAILVDLTSAPGKTIVFTRTKHRAKQLTKQLNSAGVPAVELHGNLSQAARTKNLAAFSTGTAVALVATDIAARGIHVDDVTLVVHADPPAEHQAYLHRSGRTARAGSEGTVATLATPAERREVTDLTRRAGIKATVTAVAPGHALLQDLAPGVRHLRSPEEIAVALAPSTPQVAPRPSGTSGGSRRRSSGSKGTTGAGKSTAGSAASRGASSGRPSAGRPSSSRPGRPGGAGSGAARRRAPRAR